MNTIAIHLSSVQTFARLSFMELALNLSWLAVVCLLFASVGIAHRRGQLHLSLKVALGCAAVLALLLFPVISMTDDLQQAQWLYEGHLAQMPDTGLETCAISFGTLVGLLALLLVAGAKSLLVRLARLNQLNDTCKGLKTLGRRQPSAVRPPPSLVCMLAA